MTIQPRGIRNNNPGNIRWSNDKWRGLVPKAQANDKSFCVFTDAKFGIRAIAKILQNYTKRPGVPNCGEDGIDTVYEVIHRWAPTNENNTQAYIDAVCKAMGVKQGAHINLFNPQTLLPLIAAIIKHENGINPYSDNLIIEAIKLA